MLAKTQVTKVRNSVSADGDRLSMFFGALSDVGRLNIFKLLLANKNLCVTDVANIFKISVPAASQQLKIMEMNGLVKKERQGQMICYCIRKDNPLVKDVQRMMVKAGDNYFGDTNY